MADSIPGLEAQLKSVDRDAQAIAQTLYGADRDYLVALGKVARQQLLLAAYQICTTQYPDEFLGLPLEQRQKLQGELKEAGRQLQRYLNTVLERDLDSAADGPDSLQDFVISSLFAQGQLIKTGSQEGGSAKKDDSGDAGGNKTLVVLSDEIAVEDLSEAGFSPERLAEALANALESVMGDEEEGDTAEGAEKSKTDADASEANAVDANQGDMPKGEDADARESSEPDPMPEDAAQESSAQEGSAQGSSAIGDLEDNDSPQPAGNGDTHTSFLGRYFAGQGRSPASADDHARSADDDGGSPSETPESAPEAPLSPKAFLEEVLPRYGPREIIQWQRSRERLVLLGLQRFSHQTNQILRATHAIPEPLGAPLLEGELSLTRDTSLKIPNLMAMTIRPAKKKKRSRNRPKSPPFRMVAIHLNLSDLELANPDLSRRSRNIRTLFNQIEQLNQRHQDLHRKLTVAQADQAWRSSWSGDA